MRTLFGNQISCMTKYHVKATMDTVELSSGLQHKFLKKINLSKYIDADENCLKCDVNEVDQLLSIQKLILEQPRYEKCLSLSEAEWDDNLKLAKVTRIAKNLTKKFSHSRNKSMYLYPEECLCLLEMKCLLLKWNERKLSIKNSYSLLLAAGSGCTFEQFRTYGYLVKLGFRVFRYDNKLINNNFNNKDLTKIPEISFNKKKSCANTASNVKRTVRFLNTCKNKVSFSNLKSTGWVIISRPPTHYLPNNLQPNYDTYSFNVSVSPNSSKITEMISFYETLDFRSKSFIYNESIVYNSPKPSGKYPVYEKNISKIMNSDCMYTPPIKRLKLEKSKENSLPITVNMRTTTLIDERNVHKSKNGGSMKNEENYLPTDFNKIASTSNNKNNCNITTHKNTSLVNEVVSGLNNKKIATDSTSNVNLSVIEKKDSNSEQHESTPLVTENVDTQFNISSHIKQKLFAIKPAVIQRESIINTNSLPRVRYDVYYPDNDVPKTSRPVPDFRVIVFEDDIDSFPNVHNVNVLNPNDNIPTLWAIVNSSSVSFYNVNNIILPKSTDWEIKTKDD